MADKGWKKIDLEESRIKFIRFFLPEDTHESLGGRRSLPGRGNLCVANPFSAVMKKKLYNISQAE